MQPTILLHSKTIAAHYGDFDLNDIVATIDKVTFAQHEDGSVGTYTLNGTLQAVGASKKLGFRHSVPGICSFQCRRVERYRRRCHKQFHSIGF